MSGFIVLVSALLTPTKFFKLVNVITVLITSRKSSSRTTVKGYFQKKKKTNMFKFKLLKKQQSYSNALLPMAAPI